MVQVPEDAIEIRDNTVTVKLKNIPVVDQFTFYNPFPPSGDVPALTSFEMSYTRSGTPRRVQPTSTDPASPFNWAGEMWQATGSVTFSVVYRDGSFAVYGNANSPGTGLLFGELGTERNGFFLHEEKK
jgi:hypothetical protein